MFAHPLTLFWSHLEASNYHIENKLKNRRVFTDFSNYSIFPYFSVSTLVDGPCFDPCLGMLSPRGLLGELKQ